MLCACFLYALHLLIDNKLTNDDVLLGRKDRQRNAEDDLLEENSGENLPDANEYFQRKRNSFRVMKDSLRPEKSNSRGAKSDLREKKNSLRELQSDLRDGYSINDPIVDGGGTLTNCKYEVEVLHYLGHDYRMKLTRLVRRCNIV